MPPHIYPYDPVSSSLLIGHDAFGTEVWKEFTLWVNEGDGTAHRRRLSNGLEHELEGHDLSKLELGVEPALGKSAAAIGPITTTATDEVNAANDSTNAATNAAANATIDSNVTEPVSANENGNSEKEQEKAKLIKDIAAAAKANALYASLLSTGTLAPLSHVRQLTDYLAILLFESRTFPPHQLVAEAQVARESYTRLFAAERVPPIEVLVAAKKEMMEKGGLDMETTDAMGEWAANQLFDFDEDAIMTLDKDDVRARLGAILQECREMLNSGDKKRKKREHSKRNRKNKKAAKQKQKEVEAEKEKEVEAEKEKEVEAEKEAELDEARVVGEDPAQD